MTESANRSQMSNGGLPERQGDLAEYIDVLEEHQVLCQERGKYIEADMCQERIKQLKVQLEKQRKDELKYKHQEEKSKVERAHLEEFNQFNNFWDEKMQEFDKNANDMKQELMYEHEDEYKQVKQELENTISQEPPKESSEILNLRTIERHLAKQKNYKEAHQVQQKIKKLQQSEAQNWQKVRQDKIKNQLQKLRQRQEQEMNVLVQRIYTGQDEQRKSRSIELERLLQKYQNVKKELESQNEKEMLTFGGQFKSRGTVYSKFGRSQMGMGMGMGMNMEDQQDQQYEQYNE